MESKGAENEGWTWVIFGKKWHYFRELRSLCGKWMLFSVSDLEQEDKFGHSCNCKACEKIRKKEVMLKENKNESNRTS